MINKVLVVDDEAPVRDLFTDLFQAEKYTVKTASSGEEALDLIDKDNFDVVLLDIKLPGISGIEVLKRIKDKHPKLMVIMITGFGYDEDLIAKSKQCGCSGYIGKNMPVSQIITTFKQFIENTREKERPLK